MFNNHTMSLVTDLNLVANDIRNIDFVTVAAITTSDYPDQPNVYFAGVLLPPTEILMEWADGNQLILQNEYPKYLLSKECDDMIVALIAAMTQRNIILYIPTDEYNVFGPILLNHLRFIYGITVNSPWSSFYVDPTKLPLIMAKFYMMDVMDPQPFLESYPARYALPDFVINKLAVDLNPFGGRPASFEEYRAYFNQLNASKIQQAAQPKQNMIRLVEGGEQK